MPPLVACFSLLIFLKGVGWSISIGDQNLRNASTKSFIISHWLEAHQNSDDPPESKWTVLDSYTDALRRQLGEGLHILKSGASNRKSEFNSNIICRLEARSDADPTDLELQQEIVRRKKHTDDIKRFICDKSTASDVFLSLKLKKKIKMSTTQIILHFLRDH